MTMKRSLLNILTFLLVLFSAAAFSDKLIIAGKPVALEFHEGYYSFPASYRAPVGYHFIILNHTDRVCYLDKKPQLARLDMLTIVIEEHDSKLQWNCYQYNPSYFDKEF